MDAQTRTIKQRMDRLPIGPPHEDLGAEERAHSRWSIVLALVGVLLMILAVLDGWLGM